MNALITHSADFSHLELMRARDAIRRPGRASAIRKACDYLQRNGDWIDHKQAEMVLRTLPAPIYPLRAVIWGGGGAFVALFWIFVGIPALCHLIRWGGTIVAGWL